MSELIRLIEQDGWVLWICFQPNTKRYKALVRSLDGGATFSASELTIVGALQALDTAAVDVIDAELESSFASHDAAIETHRRHPRQRKHTD